VDTTNIFWAYEVVQRLNRLVRDGNRSKERASVEFVCLNLMFEQLVRKNPSDLLRLSYFEMVIGHGPLRRDTKH